LPSAVAEGKIILDGVEINQNSRAVAYHVRDANGNMTAIPRARMIHFFKPHAINQVRGITELAQAVNPLVDIYELKRIATRSAKAQLLLALFLKGCTKKKAKGAFGAIRNAGVMDDGVTVNPESQQAEQLIGGMQGGGIFYGESDNSDAKLLTSNSPSPLVEAFITDLLMRDVFAGFGLPAEFFWNPSKLNGGNTRFILARADLFFQIMGDRLIDRFCTPIAYRYLAHRIQSGKLANPKDPNWALKISWQMPPRVNIDNGREQAILIELLENGMITMREYCNARGQNYKAVMRQWIREPIEFARIAEEEGASPEYLARLKDNLPLWRAPKPGTITANTAPDHPVTAVDENGDPLKAAA
jgi:capsid protein